MTDDGREEGGPIGRLLRVALSPSPESAGLSQKGAGRVKTRSQCVNGLRKIQMPWKGCAAIGLQALIAAIKGPTPRMAMTRLRL